MKRGDTLLELLIKWILPVLLFGLNEPEVEEKHTIYVARISWHTGIIVPGYSIPDSIVGT